MLKIEEIEILNRDPKENTNSHFSDICVLGGDSENNVVQLCCDKLSSYKFFRMQFFINFSIKAEELLRMAKDEAYDFAFLYLDNIVCKSEDFQAASKERLELVRQISNQVASVIVLYHIPETIRFDEKIVRAGATFASRYPREFNSDDLENAILKFLYGPFDCS